MLIKANLILNSDIMILRGVVPLILQDGDENHRRRVCHKLPSVMLHSHFKEQRSVIKENHSCCFALFVSFLKQPHAACERSSHRKSET